MTNQTDGAAHQEHSAGKAGSINVMAVLAYLWILVLVPVLSDAKKDQFVKFHAKQGLGLFIFEVAIWIIGWFLLLVPFLWIIWLPISWLLWLASIAFTILGIINVANGQEKELPIIGSFASKLNF